MAERLLDVAAARERVLAAARPLPSEPVELSSALGRVLAEDVASDRALPPFDASAMDGFAVVAGEAAELEVVGESRAGQPADRALRSGEAMRISTAAVVPEGAEAVVPVERPRPSAGPDRPKPGGRAYWYPSVPRATTSGGPGRMCVPASAPWRPRTPGARRGGGAGLAGTAEDPVRHAPAGGRARHRRRARRARSAARARPGPRRERLRPRRAGRARRRPRGAPGARPRRARRDVAALDETLETADAVCVSGGVSVGRHGHVKPALARLGVGERFWVVALRPGKPTRFGLRDDTLVFGLPGNPVSAMVTFHLFARPGLERLAGAAPPAPFPAVAVLDEAVTRHPLRDQAVRCTLTVGGGRLAREADRAAGIARPDLDAPSRRARRGPGWRG